MFSVGEDLDVMKTALRVLTDITERRHPAPAEVEALRQFAPALAASPLDELACDVIQQELRRRAEGRPAKGASG
jgi:hypothetical protein